MIDDDQGRVGKWVKATFGEANATSRKERAARVFEEAAELLQAEGVDMAFGINVMLRTYSRDPGEPRQEASGVMVTLFAWGEAAGVDVMEAFEAEMARVERPEVQERIRAKQAEKKAAGTTLA